VVARVVGFGRDSSVVVDGNASLCFYCELNLSYCGNACLQLTGTVTASHCGCRPSDIGMLKIDASRGYASEILRGAGQWCREPLESD
jgi:hypothetical protein